MAGTNFKVKNGLEIQSGTVIAGGGAGTNGQVLASTGTGVQWVNAATGTGDVVGPASATDNAVVRFDGTTGKLIQNSTVTLSDTGVLTVPELSTTSITSTGNNPIVIAPDGTGDVHLNADSVRIGDNNADATLITRGTGDLLLTTNEGSAVEGVIRIYDGVNGNITLTPNGTGQVQVGSDQVVTLTASQTLTNKTLSTNSTWNGNTIGVAYGGTGLTTLTAGYIPYGNGTSAFGSSANLFWDSTNSRLGIGTASPADKLQIAAGRILLDQDYQLTWQNAGTNRARIYGDSGNNIVFENGSSNTERMRIDSSGSLLIGTTSSYARLSVNNGGTSTTAFGNIVASLRSNASGADAVIQFSDNTAYEVRCGLIGGSSGAWGVYNNGERMRIDSSGNVGIGTSSPSTFGLLAVKKDQTADTAITVSNQGTAGSTTTMSFVLSEAGTAQGWLRRYRDGTGNTEIGFSDSLLFTGAVTGTKAERMRLDSSGNLGLGSTNPVYKMQIEPTSVTAGGVNNLLRIGTQSTTAGTTSRFSMFCSTDPVSDTNGGKVFIDAIRTATNMDLAFSLNNTGGAAPVERMRLTGEGNLGIGTSSPAFKLHTYVASGTSMFKFESGANAGIYGYWTRPNQSYIQALNLDNNGDKDFSLYDATNSQVVDRYYPSSAGYRAFFTNGSERMRIDSNGNVGIGTSTVLANFGGYKTLELNGTTGGLLSLDSNGTNNLQMYTNGSTVNVVTIGALPLTFGTNSTERMRLDASGNLGIGTNNPLARIDIVGDATPNGNGLAFGHANTAGYKWIQSFAVQPLYINPLGNNVIFNRDGGSVGIGTTSPTAKLDIGSNTTNAAQARFTRAPDADFSLVAFNSNTTSNASGAECARFGLSYQLSNSTNFAAGFSFMRGAGAPDGSLAILTYNAERMRITSGGSVGIGNSSPQSLLHIGGNGATTITTPYDVTFNHYDSTWGANATRPYLRKSWNATINDYLYLGATGNSANTANGAILMSSSVPFMVGRGSNNGDSLSSEFLRIDGNGNVGIGRTPSYTLDLAGDARFKRNSGSGWVFQSPSSDMRIVGETSGAHLCFLPSSANVGIDTTSPSEKLNVIGKIKASDVLLGNNGTKGYGAITTTTSTSTPTGGSSGDHYYIY